MSKTKRSIRRVFWFLALVLFVSMGYLVKLVVVDRDSIVTSSYNRRLNYVDESIQRGDILDENGIVLAEDLIAADGTKTRSYPYGRTAGHITGYSDKGKSGIEASENFVLNTVDHNLLQRGKALFTGELPKGNSVVLTVDITLQEKAAQLLDGANGAIVVMEPSTGRILALYGYPDYDPNTILEDWDALQTAQDSPLLNRVTQGLYPPGSTFKMVTALAAMEYLEDWENFIYDCTGEASFTDKEIHCYNNRAHGTVDMAEALATSCNCYFAALAEKIGAENLLKTMEEVGMTAVYGMELPVSLNKVGLTADVADNELVETSIGQGKTVVTPLYMAMLISAVANDGIMMQPYLVDHVLHADDSTSDTTLPSQLRQICTVQEAEILQNMLQGVVESGTGTGAQVEGVTVAGKTGTAENATGNDHSWFVGFAPAEDPQVAVAVLVENIGDGSASGIAGQMIAAALETEQK